MARRARWLAIGLLALTAGVLVYRVTAAPATPRAEQPSFRYDVEFPVMHYRDAPRADRVAALEARLSADELRLDGSGPRGYLASLLRALDVDVRSQVLVFSKTSLQAGGIDAATPRAIYFNDDTYVAWVQTAPDFEVASMDATLGPVFHTVGTTPQPAPRFDRQLGRCLQCHDSLTMNGGGVPRFITGSGYTGRSGDLISHEGWILTSHRTPLRSRWGGWFVTGRPGGEAHLGNLIAKDAASLDHLDEIRVGTLASLDGVLDTSPYPVATSDIVALLVLEHQVTVQNALTRAGWDARMALDRAAGGDAAAAAPDRIAEMAEPLVEALLLVGEAPLPNRIAGTSGFAEGFAARGPRDARGRSLRDLDLERRLFRYPLSYLIYSPAFDALPDVLRRQVYRRLVAILRDGDPDPRFARLSAEDRTAILAILTETKPEFAASLSPPAP